VAQTLGEIRIGISGWRYRTWRGVFYPKGLAQRQELEYVGSRFRSVEINGTFYSLQHPQYFGGWADQVPEDFQFAFKGSRLITHNKKLNDIERPLANFFAQGLLELGRRTGPFLWQFSPRFRFDEERMARFFEMLPRDSEEAARLARRHDYRVAGRATLRPAAKVKFRHAVEIRHDSFLDARFVRLLRKHKVALVCADAVDWPRRMDVTSDFVYCRLHGSKQLYASGYDAEELDRWADWVVAWATGCEPNDVDRISDRLAPKRRRRDVFVFFDNDAKVRAPFDALGLIERVERRLGAKLD
jgi:uncharacterized protein YecE (DUF72 family)